MIRIELLHFHIQSTGQKSHSVNIDNDHHNALFLLNSRIPFVCISSEVMVNVMGIIQLRNHNIHINN